MKIGILTFHAAHNYGAILQCYALQTYLKTLGHDVSVIDYRPDWMVEAHSWTNKYNYKSYNVARTIIKSIRELYLMWFRIGRYNSYEKFIRKYIYLSPMTDIEDGVFDIISIGSDQVWNTKITHGYDKFFWGAFPHKDTTKIISYAASMNDNFAETENECIKGYLTNFASLSVRESSLSEKLLSIAPELPIEHVCDPVLLLSAKEWDMVAEEPPIKEKYLLFYQVEKSPRSTEIAQSLANKYGLRLVTLSARVEDNNDFSIRSASPGMFVGLFKHADFVVCSSFHGTMFSLIYNREFVSIKMNKGKDNRVGNILNYLGLYDRFAVDAAQVNNIKSIDWGNVTVSLNQYLDSSKLYIKTQYNNE